MRMLVHPKECVRLPIKRVGDWGGEKEIGREGLCGTRRAGGRRLLATLLLVRVALGDQHIEGVRERKQKGQDNRTAHGHHV